MLHQITRKMEDSVLSAHGQTHRRSQYIKMDTVKANKKNQHLQMQPIAVHFAVQIFHPMLNILPQFLQPPKNENDPNLGACTNM